MVPATFVFGLLGLATALTVPPKSNAQVQIDKAVHDDSTPEYRSQGFRLVVNVTGPNGNDKFKPGIQGNFITGIHVGAGLALVGVEPAAGSIFYQNGTDDERHNAQATIVTDAGHPPASAGLSLSKNFASDKLDTLNLNYAPGTPGVQLSIYPHPFTTVEPAQFLACKVVLDYYQQDFVIIQHIGTQRGGTLDAEVPDDCTTITLVPQCADLPKLPIGAFSSHDYALDSPCYKDLKNIVPNRFSSQYE
ncbi:hypothetical protein G7046_g5472 [Stylonectria norvegica]|nr:hypothetical protein G7046_g5472 [Stylonectria norvegica]